MRVHISVLEVEKMERFFKDLKVLLILAVAFSVGVGILLAINFGLLKTINEDLGDIIAGLMLAGTVAAVVSVAAYYLFRLFSKPWSDVPMIATIVSILVIMGMHMIMTVELRGIKKEFLAVAKNANSKILWGAGEIHPEKGSATNPIDYGGKLDAVIAKRNAFLKKWGYVGMGSWAVNEYREVQFQMAYIFCPLIKI